MSTHQLQRPKTLCTTRQGEARYKVYHAGSVKLFESTVKSQYPVYVPAQGIGRHSLEEVTARLTRDLDACQALLQQSGAYLSGATPAAADCMLWALLDMVRDN